MESIVGAAGLAEMMKKTDAERARLSSLEVVIDSSNKISFPGYPYKMEALGEKILVSIDVFKSGFECKACNGKGKLDQECTCVSAGRAGKKYSESQLEDVRVSLGEAIALSRAESVCPNCKGDFQSFSRHVECSACKGHGVTLFIPETSKNLPTTGVVVSMGRVAQEKADFKRGDRILFGAYAGDMIPTKLGLMFKCMDWNLAKAVIEGAESMNAFDFILHEEER
jgi:co-chaperonin GroES (HSP10)